MTFFFCALSLDDPQMLSSSILSDGLLDIHAYRHSRILPYPLVMHHALSLSIIRGRGDVATRFILQRSADATSCGFVKRAYGTALR